MSVSICNIMNKSTYNSSAFWDKRLDENYKLIAKSPIYLHKLNIVLNQLSNLKGKILDVGIGYGFIEQLILKSKFDLKIYGLDISKFAISNATRNYKGNFLVGNIKQIPFDDSFFDCVLALDILEHLSVDDCMKSLREIFRVLKFNGTFILSIPLNENQIDSAKNNHLHLYDENLMKTQLDQVGFIINKRNTLTAFGNLYYLKSFFNNIFKLANPNLLILICKKK